MVRINITDDYEKFCEHDWVESSCRLPPQKTVVDGAIFIISDGVDIGLAKWESRYDGDGNIFFGFYPYGACYCIPDLWLGPITASLSDLSATNKVIKDDVEKPNELKTSPAPLGKQALAPEPQKIDLKEVSMLTDSTYQRLIKLGLSEILSEKVCTRSRDVSLNEAVQILELYKHLPASYMPIFYDTILPMTCKHVGLENGR